MTIAKTFQRNYGTRVRQTGLVRRMRGITSPKGFGSIVEGYLREELKSNYVSPDEAAAAAPDQPYERLVVNRHAPLRPGIDYTRNDASKVWTFGHINRCIYDSTANPAKLSDEERVARITKAWLKDRADNKVIAHHLVFSLDPRLTAALGESARTKDVPLDHLVAQTVADSLVEYGAHFYPGDPLGFMLGVHLDRAHAHAHVLVHPNTASGKRIVLTTNASRTVGEEKVNVQYQSVLKDAFSAKTLALAELCKEPWDKTPLHAAAGHPAADEELVLIRHCLGQPGVTALAGDVSLAQLVKSRAAVIESRGYADTITGERQRRRELSETVDPPKVKVGHKLADVAKVQAESAGRTDAAGRTVMEMDEEWCGESDRPGPVFFPEAGTPLPRSCAIPFLVEPGGQTVPSPIDPSRFLRGRSHRQRDRCRRISEAVDAYVEAVQEHELLMKQQEARLHVNLATITDTAAAVSKSLPAYLQTPPDGPRHGVWLETDSTVATRVGAALGRLVADEARRHAPIDVATLLGTAAAPHASPSAAPSSLARAHPIDLSTERILGVLPQMHSPAPDI